MALGQADDAAWQRRPIIQQRRRAVGQAHPDQFGAAAADIKKQRMRCRRLEQGRAAVERQGRLLAVADDFQLKPGLGLGAGQESVAVLGQSAGFGGDAAKPRDTAAAQFAGTDPERRQGARHRLIRQPAGFGDALAEPHDARKGIDDAKARRHRLGHQQAAIVAAEIERGIYGRAGVPAAAFGAMSGAMPGGGLGG